MMADIHNVWEFLIRYDFVISTFPKKIAPYFSEIRVNHGIFNAKKKKLLVLHLECYDWHKLIHAFFSVVCFRVSVMAGGRGLNLRAASLFFIQEFDCLID